MPNPFSSDFPIDINTLPSRQIIFRIICSRIASDGQSAIIVSESWMKKGKFLLDIPSKSEYFDNEWKLIFNFIDISTLDSEVSVAEFWEIALEPLAQYINSSSVSMSLIEQLSNCQKNYHHFSLERLMKELSDNHIRLVLLIDEFHLLTRHPLANAGIFGALRSLATRFSGFSIVGASLIGIEGLHSDTFEINKNGSPFFNYLSEIRLGVLTGRDMSILLDDSKLSNQDKSFAINVSGGHPHILQIVTSLLLDLKLERYDNSLERFKAIGELTLEKTRVFYESVWNLWTNDIQKTLISIAVVQVPDLLKNFRFESKNFFGNLPEIRYLSSIGIIEIKNTDPKTYNIIQGALLWWLAEKIGQILRPEIELKQWLREKQMVGIVFTNQDIDQLGKAAEYFGKVLDKGVITLVEAYSKSIIK